MDTFKQKLKSSFEKSGLKTLKDARDVRSETYKFIALKQKLLLASCDSRYLHVIGAHLERKSLMIREYILLLNDSIGVLSLSGELPSVHDKYKTQYDKLSSIVKTLQFHSHKAYTLVLMLENFKRSKLPQNKTINGIQKQFDKSFLIITTEEFYESIIKCIDIMQNIIEDLIGNNMASGKINDKTKEELKEAYDEIEDECD